MAGDQTAEERKAKRREVLGRVGRALAGVGLPILGGAVGGPMGASLAGRVAGALGLSEDSDPYEIEEAVVSADPALLVELRRMESDLANAQLAAMSAEGAEITDRWKADSTSDSLLAKNVRPACLAFLVLSYVIFLYVGAFADDVPSSELGPLAEGFKWILSTVILAYFGGRSGEKVFQVVRGGAA